MIVFVTAMTILAAFVAASSLDDLAKDQPVVPKPTKRSTTVIATVFWLSIAAWGAFLVLFRAFA